MSGLLLPPGSLVSPGLLLCPSSASPPSLPGTYVTPSNEVRCSVVGRLVVDAGGARVESGRHDELRGQIIDVGSLVLGRVSRVTPSAATLELLSVSSLPLLTPNSGTVRLEDVTSLLEKPELPDCFRVGDLIKARVVSLGDSRQFFLSTAEDEVRRGWLPGGGGGRLRRA
ncbi:hypothetical protein TeGR_g481 [Tetraparma gracilis]|uniref:S1 motif domain-containing protein n=1 Tax=Tetraparma gracilis TaxID=2962635 RepID=A0ABQ6MST5_9STRA|nr:hypothetical protein TeGR_g481 [Tetraparma gracilis]